MARERVLERRCRVPAPLEEVFAFFASPSNLDALTPPWLRFRMLSEPAPPMEAGSVLDYRLRLRGIPVRWQSEITVWEPPLRFVDVQRRGPYRKWVHEHHFQPCGNATEIADSVHYRVPGGPLEGVVHALLVGPDLARIFDYRERRMVEIFGSGVATAGGFVQKNI